MQIRSIKVWLNMHLSSGSFPWKTVLSHCLMSVKIPDSTFICDRGDMSVDCIFDTEDELRFNLAFFRRRGQLRITFYNLVVFSHFHWLISFPFSYCKITFHNMVVFSNFHWLISFPFSYCKITFYNMVVFSNFHWFISFPFSLRFQIETCQIKQNVKLSYALGGNTRSRDVEIQLVFWTA